MFYWWTPMRKNIATKWFVTYQMKGLEEKKSVSTRVWYITQKILTYDYNSGSICRFRSWLQMFIIIQVGHIGISRHVQKMWCVQVNFFRLVIIGAAYVLDTHDSSINEHLSLCLFPLSVSFLCLEMCSMNDKQYRHAHSRRVISCNNTSRRVHTKLLLMLEKDLTDRVYGEQQQVRESSKSCQMTVAKGQNRSILVRLWSVYKYKQLSALTQRRNSNKEKRWWDLFISFA